MFRLVPATRAGRGWLALSLSLALHTAFGAFVVGMSARTGHGTAATAPVLVLEVEAEGEQPEGPLAVPTASNHSGPGGVSAATPAPRQIAVGPSDENIVPVPGTQATVAPSGVSTPSLPHPGSAGAQHGASSGSRGDVAPAFFQVGTQAEPIVYIIDRSGSMGRGGLLTVAVHELIASLDRLPATARFQIVVYHDQARWLLPGRGELLAASAENKALVREALLGLRAEGGTCHLPALRLALTLGPQVIYLLTDADDLTHAERCEITRLNRGHAVIHTIELNTANRGRPEMPLQMLARENGGRYQAIELR